MADKVYDSTGAPLPDSYVVTIHTDGAGLTDYLLATKGGSTWKKLVTHPDAFTEVFGEWVPQP